jgi:hypothetical protein
MKTTEETTSLFDAQGQTDPGGVETQPADPGKISSTLVVDIADYPRLRQVALLRALTSTKETTSISKVIIHRYPTFTTDVDRGKEADEGLRWVL